MQLSKWGGLVLAAWLLTSCSFFTPQPAPPDEMNSVDAALLYGYIEADEDAIERVDIVEFGRIYIPPFTSPPRVLVYDNGIFMAENIKPGSYVISGFRSDRNHYNLSRSKRQTYQRIFRVQPGEMEYMGAFNLRVTKKGKINFGDFKVSELRRPQERDVLKHLYHITEGTVWQDKIARRLKALRQ